MEQRLETLTAPPLRRAASSPGFGAAVLLAAAPASASAASEQFRCDPLTAEGYKATNFLNGLPDAAARTPEPGGRARRTGEVLDGIQLVGASPHSVGSDGIAGVTIPLRTSTRWTVARDGTGAAPPLVISKRILRAPQRGCCRRSRHTSASILPKSGSGWSAAGASGPAARPFPPARTADVGCAATDAKSRTGRPLPRSARPPAPHARPGTGTPAAPAAPCPPPSPVSPAAPNQTEDDKDVMRPVLIEAREPSSNSRAQSVEEVLSRYSQASAFMPGPSA
ncbi:hypothetical protein GCM10012286_80070 [Streptomyces lasiicapitis]|uniref:Uncharacterized protein n=1 Tax=Streptomyces lasiicapitis TaxID=1923961 RepID=A0ABQ2MWP0_9ACTN|nr:hypothetical protein GCM10012286_80070 [Streptomyces lasiicapitis]